MQGKFPYFSYFNSIPHERAKEQHYYGKMENFGYITEEKYPRRKIFIKFLINKYKNRLFFSFVCGIMISHL